jgi:hypothetical protein
MFVPEHRMKPDVEHWSNWMASMPATVEPGALHDNYRTARRSLRRLSSVLANFDELKTSRMPKFCLAIIGRPNNYGWAPDKLVFSLATLVPITGSRIQAIPVRRPFDEAESWLMQYKVDWLAKHLSKKSQLGG